MAVRVWSLSTTFDALRNRDFRWLWLGRLASSATFQMSSVAQGWLVYQLTGSAFALGWVSAGWSISTLLLSPYGGVITDRLEKRTLLLWTRIGMALNSVIIGLLISTDLIRIWHLAASSLFTGMLFAFLMPAQQSIISDLVDRETLLNAISLNSLGMGLMGIFCASLAGWLIEIGGPAVVYYVMAAFYMLAIYTIIKLPETGSDGGTSASVWSDLAEGGRYLWANPLLLTLLGMGLIRVLFAMPYRTLLPAFAEDNLGFDSAGLGVLMSAPGLGALVSSLLICSLGDVRYKGKSLLIAGGLLGLSISLFVSTDLLPVVFCFIFLLGFFNNVCMVMTNTLIQARCETGYLGRVMSVYMMLWGLTPLGTLPAGAIADYVGVPPVVIVQGVIVTLLFAAVAFLKPVIWRLD
ncbi:MAG: MFS transporter [Chloroflexota bacterium]|nr:MFS transporter [Chloroflexota bacterium]